MSRKRIAEICHSRRTPQEIEAAFQALQAGPMGRGSIHAAGKQLEDTKFKIPDTKRRAHNAQSMEEQKDLQEKVQVLEKQQRQRQQIFDVEDDIESRRDPLIEALEQWMNQHSTTHQLFTLR